jgi:hypothetical protein
LAEVSTVDCGRTDEDGDGSPGQRNQIAKGFEKVDYLLNLHFARKGLLRRAVDTALGV